LVMLTGFTAYAQQETSVPPLINYQGMLTDANGNPLSGTKKLTFNIYDAAAGGNVVWGPQVFESVPMINGRFNVILGTTDNNGKLITDAFGSKDRYLGIKVDSNSEIAPRQQILSTPFAVRAEHAAKADNAVIFDSGNIWKGYTNDTDWNLNKDSGSRTYIVKIDFKKTFKQIPTVEVSLKMIDVWNGAGSRVSISSQNVTDTGFDLVFHTWSDTIVYAIGATWIAYGW